jgi:hypothetical protein
MNIFKIILCDTVCFVFRGGCSPYCSTRSQTTETIETIETKQGIGFTETKQPAVYVSLKRTETNTVSIHHCLEHALIIAESITLALAQTWVGRKGVDVMVCLYLILQFN